MDGLAIVFSIWLDYFTSDTFFCCTNKFLIVDNSKLERSGTCLFNNENYLFSFLSFMKRELTNHAVKKAYLKKKKKAYLFRSLCVNIFKTLKKKFCFLFSKVISLRGLSVLVMLKSVSSLLLSVGQNLTFSFIHFFF